MCRMPRSLVECVMSTPHEIMARADQRRLEIAALHEAGLTLKEIAARYGFTPERARQILRDVPRARERQIGRAHGYADDYEHIVAEGEAALSAYPEQCYVMNFWVKEHHARKEAERLREEKRRKAKAKTR